MKLEQACQTINTWINESQGNPILLPSGQEYSFQRIRQNSELEIGAFEKENNVLLPDSYKYFLTTVGASNCFINEYGLGFKFHQLDDLLGYSSQIFSEFDNADPQLLLIVSLTGRGDEGGFDTSRKSSDSFAVFSHEEDPSEWVNETIKWCSFENWLIKLVESEGEDDLP